MTANIAFALSAAVLSLLIVIGAALKGHWWVAAVYALLIVGFIARASYGRRDGRPARGRSQEPPPVTGPPHEPETRGGSQEPPPLTGPEHEPERRLKAARFKRR
jgi:hypothetical protein